MLSLNAYSHLIHVSLLSTHLSHEWGRACGFKEFSFAEPHFILHGADQDFAYKSACLCLLLVSVWDLAVSLFFLELGGKGGGRGLLVLAFFFYRPHRMQVSWLQVLSVLWQVICAVLFQSAAIRMHCDATGVWLKKVVFPQVFGVVVVGGKAMSNRLSVEEMALCSFK